MAAIAARLGAKLGPKLLKSAPSMLPGVGSGNASSSAAPPPPPVSAPSFGFEGGLTEKDVLRTVDDMRRAETLELIEKKKLKAMEKMAKGNLKLFILALLKDLSPYIVLAFVIFVIVMLMKGGSAASMRSRRRTTDPKKRSAFATVKSKWENLLDKILDKFAVIINFFTPGYRMRMFFNMFSPTGPRYNAIPRPQMKSGRCDNLRWIQIDNDLDKNVVLDMDGKAGKCYSSIRPKNIVWELDASKMGELYELPTKRQEDIKRNMTVTIPYTSDDSIKDGNTFFYPRCDAAYYGNDPENKADMFEDLGTSCKIKVHPLLKSKYSVADLTRSTFLGESTQSPSTNVSPVVASAAVGAAVGAAASTRTTRRNAKLSLSSGRRRR
jgi:hypothetical protein